MRISQQPACVLHARPWRETSLLLECLSRDHGRVGLVARGARGNRSRVSRSVLQPFQSLLLDFSGHGELASLSAVEPVGAPRRLQGEALLAGLYLNELLVRMLARQDPYPGLLQRYEVTLDALVTGRDLAWHLRRFERDLLAMLGYGLQLQFEAELAEPLDQDVEYVYVPEHGPVVWTGQDGVRFRGADLLAFGADHKPSPAAMFSLRQLMRSLISLHCSGGTLRSWSILAAPARRV